MSSLLRRIWSRSSLGMIASALALFSVGCAKSGKVTGKVTLPDGSPLPGGLIMFTPMETGKNPATAIIKEDGTYEAEVPVGLNKVSIDNRSAGRVVTPIGAGGAAKAPPADATSDGAKAGGPKPGGPMTGGPGNRPAAGPQDKSGPPAAKGGGGAGEIAERMKAAGKAPVESSTPVPGKAVPINQKYMSTESSGLSITVSGGTNQYDIALEK